MSQRDGKPTCATIIQLKILPRTGLQTISAGESSDLKSANVLGEVRPDRVKNPAADINVMLTVRRLAHV